jgi:hypothetical protein
VVSSSCVTPASGAPVAKRRKLSTNKSTLRRCVRSVLPDEWGCDDDVREPPERAVGRQRLGREDVEPGAAELIVEERLDERRLVDDLAASDVDEPGAPPHRRERARVEQTPRLDGERGRDGDRIGPMEQVVEAVARPGRARLVAGRRATQSGDLHPERLRESRRLAPDRTEPDDPEPHPVQVDRCPGFPAAFGLVSQRPGEVTTQREQVRHHGLGDGRCRGTRAVGHGHAASAEGREDGMVGAGRHGVEPLQPLGAQTAAHEVGRAVGPASGEKNATVIWARSLGVTCSSPTSRTTSTVGSIATMSSPRPSQNVS